MGLTPKTLVRIVRGILGGKHDTGGSRLLTVRQAGNTQAAQARYQVPAPPVENKPATKQAASQ